MRVSGDYVIHVLVHRVYPYNASVVVLYKKCSIESSEV